MVDNGAHCRSWRVLRYNFSMWRIQPVIRLAPALILCALVLATCPAKVSAITCGAGSEIGVSGVCRVVLTTADVSPWSVPSDWSNASNTIEVIGGGGGGGGANQGTSEGAGGGGGAYARVHNVQFSGGASAVYQVGTGGPGSTGTGAGTTGGDTFFNRTAGSNNDCTDTVTVCAKGGAGGSGSGGSGVAGGQADSSVGDVKWSGGGSGNASGSVGTGGGGAGGLNGYGATSTAGTATGATADAGQGGTGGSGGNPGTPGGAGAEWEVSYGSGGGGGGGNGNGANAGQGGQYGGGGGGADSCSPAVCAPGIGGDGAPGLIVITYEHEEPYFYGRIIRLLGNTRLLWGARLR